MLYRIFILNISHEHSLLIIPFPPSLPQSVIEICLTRLSISSSGPGTRTGSGIVPNMVDQSTRKTVFHTSASKTTNIVCSISNFFTQPSKSKKNNDDKDNNSNDSGSGSGNTDSNMKWNATNNRENFNLIKDEEIEQLVRSR